MRQQQQRQQQSQNEKENCNSTTPIKGNLSVNGTSSFGGGLNKNTPNSKSAVPKRRQRSWGAPSGVINTPKSGTSVPIATEENSINSHNSIPLDNNCSKTLVKM